MAIAASTMRFYRTGAVGANGDSAFDPNASLGDFRAAQTANLESTLTAAMTAHGTLVDATRVDDTPAGPVDPRTPLADSGSYASSERLKHWYRFSYDPFLLGRDYGLGPVNHLDQTMGGLNASDIDAGVQPGQFDQQRNSLHFNSAGAADNDALRTASGGQTWGIANAWTIAAWLRTTTVAAGNATFFNLKPGTTAALGDNGIKLRRNGTSLFAEIGDAAGVANAKRYEWTSVFAVNTWQLIASTWDGTTLKAYVDGVDLGAPDVTTEDDAVAQSNTSDRRLIVGGGNVSALSDPNEEWQGQIHELMVWDVTIGPAGISALTDFGDGVGEPPLDHADDWLVFTSGTNSGEARRITFHDNATGELRVDRPFTGLAASGDAYRIGRARELFNDGPTAPESSAGVVDHRCLAFRNESGETLQNLRFYLTPLDPRSISFRIAASETDIGATGIPPIAVDTDPPDIKTIGVNAFASSRQEFRQPRTFAQAAETPGSATATGDLNLTNNSAVGVWLERTAAPLTRTGTSAWLLVAEAESGSVSGAGPWRSALILASEPVGFAAAFTAAFDVTPRTFGGSRVTVRLVDATTGVPVEDVDVFVALTTGPGVLTLPAAPPIATDEDGIVRGAYASPEDDAETGSTVEITATFYGD